MEYLFTYNFVSACSKNNLYLTLIIYAYLPNVTSSPTDYSGGGWDRLVSGGRCQEWAHFFVIFCLVLTFFLPFLLRICLICDYTILSRGSGDLGTTTLGLLRVSSLKD